MKTLRIIAQVVGYLVIALAAVMLVSGAPWACVFLLIIGGLGAGRGDDRGREDRP